MESFLDCGNLFSLWLHPSSACCPLTVMGIDGGEINPQDLQCCSVQPLSWKRQNTHAAECFKMCHFRTECVTESRSVGILSILFAVIISWMCIMGVKWWKVWVRKLIKKKKKAEPGCIFQLPASPPPSQSLFYKSVSSLHCRADTATPSTLIACYSPLKIITCSSPWLRSTFHF